MSAAPPAHLQARLAAAGQEHVLAFWDELDEASRASLAAEVEALDLERLPSIIREAESGAPLSGALTPAPTVPLAGADPCFRAAGEALLRAGKVAAFTVAGGQGTRLGFDAPKGLFPAAPVSGKPLFQLFAEQLLATGRRYGTTPRWYIMTSPATDASTRAFFAEHRAWGLDAAGITFLIQGELPAFDLATGRLLLASKGALALSPDGHGGAIAALHRSGALTALRDAGVEHLSYFQVDNPLVRALDPVFLGLHASHPGSSGEMTSKCVMKTAPEERVGVFARDQRGTLVVEYSDLPLELAEAREPDGALCFRAGSIAVHAFSVAFLQRVASEGHLPFHRAEKRVACMDLSTGALIEPPAPNALKLEQFIFDALPFARSALVVETAREEEFAPIKNAAGADSPETSKRAQTDRAARWLKQAGVAIPEGATVEISPLTALEPADVAALAAPLSLAPGAALVI